MNLRVISLIAKLQFRETMTGKWMKVQAEFFSSLFILWIKSSNTVTIIILTNKAVQRIATSLHNTFHIVFLTSVIR